jgi:ABC-type Fe3+-hydroxamate transport system substrate-binding protein
MRVVSLVPSVTETLLAWGVTPVACTRFCEQPTLHHVGGTKDPDIAAIAALAPDLVVVDREENRREDAEAMSALGLTLHVTHVVSVGDVAVTLDGLSEAVGAGDPSTWRMLRSAPSTPAVRLRAFVPIWRKPWMTVNDDTYGASLLRACGVANVYGTASDRYPTVTLEQAAGTGADSVLLPSEPYAFAERHIAEVSIVASDVRLIDGRDLFWWGVRTPGALERLAQATASR